eukprot:516266-Rhodomonas_salina.1
MGRDDESERAHEHSSWGQMMRVCLSASRYSLLVCITDSLGTAGRGAAVKEVVDGRRRQLLAGRVPGEPDTGSEWARGGAADDAGGGARVGPGPVERGELDLDALGCSRSEGGS